MNLIDSFSVSALQQRFYPEHRRLDPIGFFLEEVELVATPEMTAIELGAGAGELHAHDIRGHVEHLVGIDLSPRVLANPNLDEALVADALDQPFSPNTFDLAFCVYVLEHIANPDRFCREAARVLRPGGQFLALTPNLYHYVSGISRVAPHWVHEAVGRHRGHIEHDIIPTYYRLNTRKALARHLFAAGFARVEFSMIEVQPNYMTWSTAAFLAGSAYERLVNSTTKLAWARVNIVVSAWR
jgi:SAM-dependent methyltransferase